MIGNYRVDEPPGYWEQLRAELGQRQVLTEFRLRALQEQKVRDLMSNLLGDIPSEELCKQVLSQCTGNPFYIYEFLRFLRDEEDMGVCSFDITIFYLGDARAGAGISPWSMG